jgi:hypothetical protein
MKRMAVWLMALEDHDIDRLKEIFVTRQECQKQTEGFESKLNKDNIRLAVIETKLGQITWLLGAVVGGIITMLIKMFFFGG